VQDGSRKAIVAAFFANLGIAIAKFVGFLITGSAGLIAEAGHSAADTGNQGLLLFGSKRARRTATKDHPFGFGRERYFWAFVVALVLFSMGGLFALYEGIQKLRHPHETDNAIVAFVILGVAFVLESFSLRTALREARHVRHGRSLWQFIRTAKQPELPVVVLEDIGAEVGLLFALGGLTLAEITGNPRWDAAGSIAIGLLLVVIAAVLAIETKGLLIGEAAEPEQVASLHRALGAEPPVRRVIHLRTEHIGPDELLVAAKLEFDPTLTFAELAAAIDAAETRARAAVPTATLIYIEPDVYRPTDAAS
jgi:cation diffusion facilitator family transporter